MTSNLKIGHKSFSSRLFTGTGKYKSTAVMKESLEKSKCEVVTVAIRRVQSSESGHEGLMEAIDWQRFWMLPNTAGCTNAEDAIRVARLGRELAKLSGQEDNNFIKLEVIPDKKYLLPDPFGTLEAAEQLIKEGFEVLPYINSDPLLAKRLEEIGCATVMPLGSAIGSAQGIRNTSNIQIIIENAKIPVIVDAGIGVPSHAAEAMEMGADAVLINSAIALAQNAPLMAEAMYKGVEAGRQAFLAGRLEEKEIASASSPKIGIISNQDS
ncbi:MULTISPECIES: thiazole synthase [Prochlorococcus]|uniref:thiazole synthase n=1 Tax=Prochlorococcus TaxID=1218 RepID=UPI00056137D1|nr:MULTISPECIES: thiazole synthase [Prochlorococcus]